jgi:RHS repeat-associated protein
VAVEAAAFDAWGNFLGGVPADRYGFAGREWDATLGLSYNRARLYDPALGRMRGEDPIGFAAGDPNLYRYAGNGPTGYTDPSGLWSPSRVLAIIAGRDPLVAKFLADSKAILNVSGHPDAGYLNNKSWGSKKFGWIGDRPDITIPAWYSDEEAADAILYQFMSPWWGEYNQDFHRYLKRLVNDAAFCGDFEDLRAEATKRLSETTKVLGKDGRVFLAEFYANVVPGGTIADAMVRVVDGDVDLIDLASLAPFLSKLKGKKNIAIVGADGKSKTVAVADIEKAENARKAKTHASTAGKVARTAGSANVEAYRRSIGPYDFVDVAGLQYHQKTCVPAVLQQRLGNGSTEGLRSMFEVAERQGGYALEDAAKYLRNTGVAKGSVWQERITVDMLREQTIAGNFTLLNVRGSPGGTGAHAVGIEGFDAATGRFLIHDPLLGTRYWQSAEALQARMIGDAILVK